MFTGRQVLLCSPTFGVYLAAAGFEERSGIRLVWAYLTLIFSCHVDLIVACNFRTPLWGSCRHAARYLFIAQNLIQ